MFGDGSSIRDYTFIDDIVQGVVASVDRKNGWKSSTWASQSHSLDALIASIVKSFKRKPIIKQLPDQPGDVPMTFADVNKAKQLLDYKPANQNRRWHSKILGLETNIYCWSTPIIK